MATRQPQTTMRHRARAPVGVFAEHRRPGARRRCCCEWPRAQSVANTMRCAQLDPSRTQAIINPRCFGAAPAAGAPHAARCGRERDCEGCDGDCCGERGHAGAIAAEKGTTLRPQTVRESIAQPRPPRCTPRQGHRPAAVRAMAVATAQDCHARTTI